MPQSPDSPPAKDPESPERAPFGPFRGVPGATLEDPYLGRRVSLPDSELLILLQATMLYIQGTTKEDGPVHAEDVELMGRALRGDPEATAKLLDRLTCVPGMVRSKNKRLGYPLSEVETEDAIQNTLLAIWSKRASFRGASSLETWAYAFGVFEILKVVDRRHSARSSVEYTEEHAPRVEPEDSPADIEALAAALDTVDPLGAKVVRLKHFSHLTFEEVGLQLELPTNTVKTRYYRTLERLRGLLSSGFQEMTG